VWAEIRAESVYRMQTVSSNHANVVTGDRPGGRRIGPNAIALLYAHPRRDKFGQAVDSYTIEPASRIFAWSDDQRREYNVKDAPVLMRTMLEIATQEHNAGSFDPLTLTDRGTEPLPAGSVFVGIGLSSLGESHAEWGNLKATAFGLELPARCLVRLTDQCWIEMSHEGRGQWRVDANVSLGYMSYFDTGRSIPPDWTPRPESAHWWLDMLVDVCARAYKEMALERERQRTSTQHTGGQHAGRRRF
jgi:hypothetical protein